MHKHVKCNILRHYINKYKPILNRPLVVLSLLTNLSPISSPQNYVARFGDTNL